MRNKLPVKGIFLDRDGTIIEDRGHLKSIEDVHFYPDTFESLRALQKEFMLFIVTNQSGVSRGIIKKEDADRINSFVNSRLLEKGIKIAEIYTCYHQKNDNCECIKPKSFFPKIAAAEFGISLQESWSAGDHLHDVDFGYNFGGRGVYLLTGHGANHLENLYKENEKSVIQNNVFKNLKDASSYILNESRKIPVEYVTPQAGAEIIRGGGIVAIPTETVYGLAADALDEAAVLKVFEAKKRPRFDPLIVHGTSIDNLRPLIKEFPEKAELLAKKFWPGPLTLVLPRTSIVPDIVTAGLETVAVRVPSHPVARKIIELSGVNVAAPSANPFGEISPTLASHVLSQLGDKIDGIVDGGKSSVGIESTIIGCVNNEYVLLRPGGISREDIEAITGTLITHDNSEIITAPGTMKRHYSPNTNMILQNHTDPLPEDFQDYKKVGRLTYGSTFYNDCEIELNLSPAGDLKDAAVNLYHYMRKLDKMNLELIIADRVPQSGLGAGINDRLSRAASRD